MKKVEEALFYYAGGNHDGGEKARIALMEFIDRRRLPKSDAIMAFIDEYQARYGKTPTSRQIAAEVGISEASTMAVLRRLSRDGEIVIEKKPNGRINIVLTKKQENNTKNELTNGGETSIIE